MASLKIIDWKLVEKLCALQCTGEEIASTLDIDYDTLNTAIKREHNSSFSDYFKKHSSKGKMSLRRKQFETAQGGNVPMLIWLGKQYLDQKDKQASDVTTNGESINKPTINVGNLSDEQLRNLDTIIASASETGTVETESK